LVTVLDASAIIALLLEEPAADDVESLLDASDAAPKLSAVNMGEVIDQLVRVRGMVFDDVIERLMWLAAGGLEIADADLEIAASAGFLRARHYRRRDQDVSIADCYALATASVLEEPLATSDQAVATVARYEEIELVALPDSTGDRPV
jgi:PIN domain nuclease of toxin-antitoxin system